MPPKKKKVKEVDQITSTLDALYQWAQKGYNPSDLGGWYKVENDKVEHEEDGDDELITHVTVDKDGIPSYKTERWSKIFKSSKVEQSKPKKPAKPQKPKKLTPAESAEVQAEIEKWKKANAKLQAERQELAALKGQLKAKTKKMDDLAKELRNLIKEHGEVVELSDEIADVVLKGEE